MLPLRPYSISDGNDYDFMSKRGFRQAKPYDLDTPLVSVRRSMRGDYAPSAKTSMIPQPFRINDFDEVDVLNKLYKKFVDELGDGSSFGATLTAERKETLGLVADTALRLARAAKAVKKMDLPLAANELGLPYFEKQVKVRVRRRRGNKKPRYVDRTVFTLPDGRTVAKTMASGWLMWSYGVKPLASDIYNGMDVLQRPVPDKRIKVRASGSTAFSEVLEKPVYFPSVTTWAYKVSVSCSATVSVSNPNLWLANKMGLTNPVQWALEAVTLSFVADWFSNLSDVVGSISDFHGLSIGRPCTCKLYTLKWQVSGTDWEQSYYTGSRNESLFIRELSMPPTPTLRWGYERPVLQRGLNAISLLVGVLK